MVKDILLEFLIKILSLSILKLSVIKTRIEKYEFL